MKVCYINPPFKTEYGKFSRESRSPSIGHSGVLYYPLWMIYSAALLEKNGYEVVFLDSCAKMMDRDASLEFVSNNANDAKLFVINTSTPSIFSDVSFSDEVKRICPNSFVVLVGTHPTATPGETMGLSGLLDGIARREYDQVILDLASTLSKGGDLSSVKGLTYREGSEIVHNQDASPIQDMDSIPFASEFIKRHLDVGDYLFPAAAMPEIQIFTGRGCRARCNYCVYNQTMYGRKYRARSAENVVKEFEYIVEEFPQVKEIVIEDDTFTVDKQRVVDICNLLIEKGLNKKIKWLCNARVDLDFETMKKMKQAGCHLIIPGVESYNQEILNNVKKGTTLEQIDRYMADAKRAKLMVHACYMVGNKGETRETMENTLNAAMRFKTDTAQFFPLIPYPGTEAYDWAKENGYISGKYDEYVQEDGAINCVLNLPGLSSSDLVDFCAKARKKYYLRPWYIGYRIVQGLKDPDDLKRSLKAFGRLRKSLFG